MSPPRRRNAAAAAKAAARRPPPFSLFLRRALALAACLPRAAEGLSVVPPPPPSAAETAGVGTTASSSSSSVRPLQRNWWPVSLESALKAGRPNGVELLGRKLVLWKADADDADEGGSEAGGWSCLDDACAHRFAPLSEGRVVPIDDDDDDADAGGARRRRLQCAYHGWEFDGRGSCGRVPQAEAEAAAEGDDDARAVVGGGRCDVPSYPVRLGAGMVWVWSDPDPSPESRDLAASVPLPVSPLLEKFCETELGGKVGFQRDLPYGAELLGENLLDLSHLPFSHHGVGNLRRDVGGALPLRMLSKEEKAERASWEDEFRAKYGEGGGDEDEYAEESARALPMFQAEVVDAAAHDPTFRAMKAAGVPLADDATCEISFHEPCHVRYRRLAGGEGGGGGATHVELFLCPTAAGRSRVFLYNVFERTLPPPSVEEKGGTKGGANTSIRPPAPKVGLVGRLKRAFKRPLPYDERVVMSHMMAHSIFDGDGIFLHKQGDRMERSYYTYRDYSTPSSADVLVNAYRRYLDAAARSSVDAGGLRGMAAAQAATGGAWSAAASVEEDDDDEGGSSGAASFRFPDVLQTAEGGLRRVPPGAYSDADDRRSDLLDRRASHTASCEACSAALRRLERTSDRADALRTAFLGASGAAAAATAAGLGAAAAGAAPLAAAGAAAAGLGATVAGVKWTEKAQKKMEEMRRKFEFEDYVHAEKN